MKKALILTALLIVLSGCTDALDKDDANKGARQGELNKGLVIIKTTNK